MQRNINVEPVNKTVVMQVLETIPSVRPEVYVALLLQDWRLRDLYVFRETKIEGSEVSVSANARVWNPRSDVVEYLADLDKATLSEGGFSSTSEFLLRSYASNMKKLGTISDMFSATIKHHLRDELPLSLSAFMMDYLAQKGISQVKFANEIGVSQSLVSNAVNEKPISTGLLKILDGLKVEDEVKEAVFELYAPAQLRSRPEEVAKTSYRQGWADDLYNLDRLTLNRLGFDGVEAFLLTRFINTSNKLGRITQELDALPDLILPTDIKQGKSLTFGFPSIDQVNQISRAVPVLLRVWESRGLYLPPERVSSI